MVISKGIYDNDTFLETSINGEFNFIKRPDAKSFKIVGLSRTFLHNLQRRPYDFDVSTDV